MGRDEDRYHDLADSVSDSADIDWDRELRGEGDAAGRGVVEALKSLATIAAAYRKFHSAAEVESAGEVTPHRADHPARWGHLQIVEKLGEGGFSVVFRARDPDLEREVALKLLRHSRLGDERDRRRAVNEGRLLARVKHPNVATVYGAAEHDGRVGLWMELIEGKPLSQLVEEQGLLGAREAALVGIDVCRAVAAVHGCGLLHCDIKPQNVMREAGGRIVLMDFGMGRAIVEGRAVQTGGTPLYMAPEVLLGASATPRSDIYSLGVLLFYLVTRSHPVQGRNLQELLKTYRTGRPRLLRDLRPDLPEAYFRVVERALSLAPEERYESAGALEAALEGTLGSAAPSAGEAGPGPLRPGKGRVTRRLFLAGSAVALLAAGAAAWLAREPVVGTLGRQIPDERRLLLAVFPFKSIAPDDRNDYLAEGMTEQLITRLGQVHSLGVISKRSVEQALESNRSRKEISRLLGDVPWFLDGSIQVEGDTVEVKFQLSGVDDRIRLARAYQQPIESVFSLQNAVAREIVDALEVELSPRTRQQLATARNVDPEAYRRYTAGRHSWNRRDDEAFLRAAQLFEEAALLDEDFALPHAGLADVYALAPPHVLETLLADSRPEIRTVGLARVAREAAREQATRALDLEPGLGEAHATLAFVEYFLFWNWKEAEAQFRLALDHSPSYATAHHWYADFATAMGRTDVARAQIREARQLDPRSMIILRDTAWSEFMEGHYPRVVEILEPLTAAGGQLERYRAALTLLARAYTHAGRPQDAAGLLRQVIDEFGPDGHEEMLAEAYAVAGRTREARLLLDKVAAQTTEDRQWPYAIALVYIGLGEREAANDWLWTAYERRDRTLVNVGVDRRLDPLRGDERFTRLMERMRFPPLGRDEP